MSTSSAVVAVVVAAVVGIVLTRNQASLNYSGTACFPSGCHCQVDKDRHPLP